MLGVKEYSTVIFKDHNYKYLNTFGVTKPYKYVRKQTIIFSFLPLRDNPNF